MRFLIDIESLTEDVLHAEDPTKVWKSLTDFQRHLVIYHLFVTKENRRSTAMKEIFEESLSDRYEIQEEFIGLLAYLVAISGDNLDLLENALMSGKFIWSSLLFKTSRRMTPFKEIILKSRIEKELLREVEYIESERYLQSIKSLLKDLWKDFGRPNDVSFRDSFEESQSDF